MPIDPRELPIYEALDELGIAYERFEHKPTVTMEICGEVDRITGVEHCKNLFLTNRRKSSFYLAMMGANKRFQTALISRQLDCSRLSFADDGLLNEKLQLLPGAVTPLGLIYDKRHEIIVVIDEDIKLLNRISVHTGVSTASIALKTTDLLSFIAHCGNRMQFVKI